MAGLIGGGTRRRKGVKNLAPRRSGGLFPLRRVEPEQESTGCGLARGELPVLLPIGGQCGGNNPARTSQYGPHPSGRASAELLTQRYYCRAGERNRWRCDE